MFAVGRLLSSSRHLIQRNALPCKKITECRKASHIAYVPPEKRVPSGEFFAMSLALLVSVTAYPMWVLYHIPDYQKENRHEYTGK